MTALSIVSMAASSAARSRRRPSGWRRGSPRESRTSPIWRRPFITSVEPVETRSTIALGQAEPRRDLDGAGDRDDLDGDRPLREEPAGGVRVGRRDPQAGEVLDGLVRRVVRDGRGEPAAAVAEDADARQLGAGLAQEVDAGDPEVGDAVADELDDVVRPDEQDVEVEVLDARDQAAVVLLEDEAGVVEQPQRRLDEPALVRDREAQARGSSLAGDGVGVVPARDAPSSLSSIAR